MIISQFPSSGGSAFPRFLYTGRYAVENGAQGWKLKLLSSGTLTMYQTANVDIFLVGGGGDGSTYSADMQTSSGTNLKFGGGGGGGYTLTQKNLLLTSGQSYTVVVGDNGDASSITPDDNTEWSGAAYSANGGSHGGNSAYGAGGNGGSGGGSYLNAVATSQTMADYYRRQVISGGTDGANGTKYGTNTAGTGQGTTTREFGETDGDLYASGGAGCFPSRGSESIPNTGNGGDTGFEGASGIVIIRNARA